MLISRLTKHTFAAVILGVGLAFQNANASFMFTVEGTTTDIFNQIQLPGHPFEGPDNGFDFLAAIDVSPDPTVVTGNGVRVVTGALISLEVKFFEAGTTTEVYSASGSGNVDVGNPFNDLDSLWFKATSMTGASFDGFDLFRMDFRLFGANALSSRTLSDALAAIPGFPENELVVGFEKTGIANQMVKGSGSVRIAPEPSVLALFGVGFAGVGFARRRKKT